MQLWLVAIAIVTSTIWHTSLGVWVFRNCPLMCRKAKLLLVIVNGHICGGFCLAQPKSLKSLCFGPFLLWQNCSKTCISHKIVLKMKEEKSVNQHGVKSVNQHGIKLSIQHVMCSFQNRNYLDMYFTKHRKKLPTRHNIKLSFWWLFFVLLSCCLFVLLSFHLFVLTPIRSNIWKVSNLKSHSLCPHSKLAVS